MREGDDDPMVGNTIQLKCINCRKPIGKVYNITPRLRKIKAVCKDCAISHEISISTSKV